MEPTYQPLFACKNVICLSVAFCYLLWGSAYLAIKNGYEIPQIAMDDIPSETVFAGYRLLSAGLLPLLLVVAQRKPIGRLSPRQYGQLTLLGLAQVSLRYISLHVGLMFTAGVKGPIMNATGTFFSVPLAHFTYHNDKLSYNKALGCILDFTGVMVVSFSSGMDFNFNLLGDGSVVVAAFILSAAALHEKRTSQMVDPTVTTGYQLDDGDPALVIGGHAFGGTLTVHDASSVVIPDYLTLLPSTAFILWSILFRHNHVGITVPSNFLILVSSAVLSATFLSENILEQKYAIAPVLVCSGIRRVNEVKR